MIYSIFKNSFLDYWFLSSRYSLIETWSSFDLDARLLFSSWFFSSFFYLSIRLGPSLSMTTVSPCLIISCYIPSSWYDPRKSFRAIPIDEVLTLFVDNREEGETIVPVYIFFMLLRFLKDSDCVIYFLFLEDFGLVVPFSDWTLFSTTVCLSLWVLFDSDSYLTWSASSINSTENWKPMSIFCY
jgi:hypothetical protein